MLRATTRKKTLLNNLFNSDVSVDKQRQIIGQRNDTIQWSVSRLELLSELEAVREFERHRLARELHDQMGQDLAALTLGLRSLKKEFCVMEEVTNKLEQLQLIVGQLNQQVHDIAWDLRPLILDDLGLRAALATLLEKWTLNTGVRVDFQYSRLDGKELPKALEIGVYRIIQESLNNVAKHAQAQNVSVVVASLNEGLIVRVSDDGLGFDPSWGLHIAKSNQCFGLLGIRERVELLSGTFEIVSGASKGTTVKVTIPIYFQ